MGETMWTSFAAVRSSTFLISLCFELMGVTLFAFLGSTAGYAINDSTGIVGPLVNGLALAVLVYSVSNVSGGHLNPAVTLSTLCCGYYPALHSALYITAQLLGGVFGSMLAAGLVPRVDIGMGNQGPGCLDAYDPYAYPDDGSAGGPPHLETRWQLFGWEFLMTFALIAAFNPCGLPQLGRRSSSPLVAGLTLMACAGTGAVWTGAMLNPARVVGPAFVFHCSGSTWWVYVAAQLMAGLAACCLFAFVNGWGPLSPFVTMRGGEHALTWREALCVWATSRRPAGGDESQDPSEVEAVKDVLKSLEASAPSGRAASDASSGSKIRAVVCSRGSATDAGGAAGAAGAGATSPVSSSGASGSAFGPGAPAGCASDLRSAGSLSASSDRTYSPTPADWISLGQARQVAAAMVKQPGYKQKVFSWGDKGWTWP